VLSRSPLHVDIGGQKHRNDLGGSWVIADINRGADVVIDLNAHGLPFHSGSVDAIYTSHTLEHILPGRQAVLFEELYRVLKPGAIIRIVVPDIAKAVHAYVNGDTAFLQSSDNPSKLKSLPDLKVAHLSAWFFSYGEDSDSFLGGHVMSFDDEMLTHLLRQARFEDVTKKRFGDHSPVFAGKDMKRYENCSLYYEARKPR
jgi:predicted SAM-dependent methyltransferase